MGYTLRHRPPGSLAASGFGHSAEETKRTRSVRYRADETWPPWTRNMPIWELRAPRRYRKGAQNRHAYLRQTSDWHLPDTDGIKVPAWLGRYPLAHGLPHLGAGHKTY